MPQRRAKRRTVPVAGAEQALPARCSVDTWLLQESPQFGHTRGVAAESFSQMLVDVLGMGVAEKLFDFRSFDEGRSGEPGTRMYQDGCL